MQGIWSRAAQAHNCRCKACLRPANGLVRRSTTRCSPRKASISDVFTACYTTIMAAAAVADAQYKDKRRKDLDQSIYEAKAELRRTKDAIFTGELSSQTPSSPSDSWAPPDLLKAIDSICVPFPECTRLARLAEKRRHDLFEMHQDFLLRRRWLSEATKPPDLDRVQQAMLEEESRQGPSDREPKTSVHLARTTDVVNKLVDDLLLEAHRESIPDDPAALRASIESLDSPWTAIKLLRSDGYPQYQYPAHDNENTLAIRRDVNNAARSIFSDWEQTRKQTPVAWHRKRVKFWVAKLSHNLLVSAVPPGIHNYNTLILGFSRVGHPRLAQVVIDAYLDRTHLRPTQQTLVSLLHHYQMKGDGVAFYRLMRRFVGIDAMGPKLRRKSYESVQQYPFLQKWARNHDVAVTDGFIIQRARLDEDLCEAFIRGLLSFGQTTHAAKLFVAILKAGYSVSVGILRHLLNAVVDSVDETAARRLLGGLAQNMDRIEPMLLSGKEDTRKLALKLHLLIGIAGLKRSPQRPYILESPTLGSRHRWRHFTIALFVSDTAHYLRRLRDITVWAQRYLSDDSDMVDFTQKMAGELSLLSSGGSRLEWQKERYARMTRLCETMSAADRLEETSRLLTQTFHDTMSEIREESSRPMTSAESSSASDPQACLQPPLDFISKVYVGLFGRTAREGHTKATVPSPAHAM